MRYLSDFILFEELSVEREEVIKNVEREIKAVKGVGYTYILDDEDRKNISELEEKADQMTLMGLGIGDNKGVKEVLKCDIVMPFTTDMEYEWPPDPNVILMHKGEMVGEDVSDPEKLKEWEGKEDTLVIGNIVIYGKSVLTSVMGGSEPLVVVLPPKECPPVAKVSGVKEAILASPSPPTDEYLKEKMDLASKCGAGTGSFLLGINFEEGI
jgi:hypothetical protein